eukprot:gene7450-8272_t
MQRMEEIIYDFIRLEDDIIDDLCRDVPFSDNFERFAIGNAVDFQQSKLKELQHPSSSSSLSSPCNNIDCSCRHFTDKWCYNGITVAMCDGAGENCCEESQQRESNCINCHKPGDDNNFMDEHDAVVDNTRGNRINERNTPTDNHAMSLLYADDITRRTSAALCEELISNTGSCRDVLLTLEPIEVEMVKVGLEDAVITKSEICAKEIKKTTADCHHENTVNHLSSKGEVEESGGELKIKIEMVKDVDIPFGEDGEVPRDCFGNFGDGCENLRTTKIKCRVPRDVIDKGKGNKEVFNNQLVCYLSKRISKGALFHEGEMLNLTNEL